MKLQIMSTLTGRLLFNLALSIFLVPVAARAQGRFDITPMFDYNSSMSFPVASGTAPEGTARIAQSEGFSVAAGGRYDGEVVEFRYSRQPSTIRFEGVPSLVVPFSTDAVLERYLGDFTHEFVLDNQPTLRPFLFASLGMSRLSAAGQSYNRFAFGAGAGVKWFPLRWLGVRAHGQWLPTLFNPEVKGFACGGGCVVRLGARLTSHVEISLGPVFTS
jgi:hypothetical protein